ncbi:hypothetical protein [Cesiribacter sp. SM1]|uniref:hypothetical protein n=1 Tax=Cesiribacter sp. SM1 TaxID=2861196 RepID=UPI001CD7FF55|nr:hypothetical protein [Cesiribacter sp. SM1]
MADKASIPGIKKGAGFFEAYSPDVKTERESPAASLQKRYALLGRSLQLTMGVGVFLFSWSLAVLLFSPYPKPDTPPDDELTVFTDSLKVDTTAVTATMEQSAEKEQKGSQATDPGAGAQNNIKLEQPGNQGGAGEKIPSSTADPAKSQEQQYEQIYRPEDPYQNKDIDNQQQQQQQQADRYKGKKG